MAFETQYVSVNRGARAYAEAPSVGLLTATSNTVNALSEADTTAQVEDGARLQAGGSVSVEARTVNDARTRGQAEAFSGASFGLMNSTATSNGTSKALLEGDVEDDAEGIGAASVSVIAQSKDISNAEGRVTNGSLSTDATDMDVTASVTPIIAASIGDYAQVRATGDILQRALSEANAGTAGRGTAVGLLGTFGAASATSEIKSDIDVSVGQGATVASTTGAITIDAYHNYLPSVSDAPTSLELGAFSDAFAPGGGIVSVKTTKAKAEASANVETAIAEDAVLSAGGALSIGAAANNVAEASSQAISGSVAGFGSTTAEAKANGVTRAHLDGDIAAAGSVEIGALGRNTADALGRAVSGGLAAAINVTSAKAYANSTTEAYIGDGTAISMPDVSAAGDIEIAAQSVGSANALVKGIAVAGAVGIGDSTSTAEVNPTVNAYIGEFAQVGSSAGGVSVLALHNEKADGSSIPLFDRDGIALPASANAVTEASSGGLAGGVSANQATATSSPTISAYVGDDAVVTADGAVALASQSEADANAEAQGYTIGLGFGVGVMFADATASPILSTYIGADAQVSGTGISLLSSQNDGTTKGAHALSKASGGGIGLSGQGAVPTANANATLDTYVDAGAVLHGGTGAVSLTSKLRNEADAKAEALSIGALAVGASLATANADGSALAHMDGTVSNGGALIIESQAKNDADAVAEASSGGLIAANLPFAHASASPTVSALVGDDTKVTVTGLISISATSESDSDASAKGLSLGVGAVGVMQSSATTSPVLTAGIGDDSKISGGALSITTAHNWTAPSTFGASALSEASGGGLFGSGQGAVPTANANANLETYVGSGASLDIGSGAIELTSHARNSSDATAKAFSIGIGLAVGASIANSTSNGLIQAHMDGHITHGGSLNVEVSTIANANAKADASGGGLIEAMIPIAKAVVSPVLTARIGNGASAHVDGAATVSATSEGGVRAETIAKSGGLIGIGSMSSEAEMKPSVTAYIGNGATVDAGSVSVLSEHNFGTDNEAFAKAVAAKGAGLSFQKTNAKATASAALDSYVGDGAEITADTSLLIRARGQNDARALADGLNIGILLAVGEVDSTAVANGSARARIKDSAILSADPRIDVGSLTVAASSQDSANAKTDAAGGGLVSVSSNDTTAKADSVDLVANPDYATAEAYIGENSSILASGSVSVTAVATPEADSNTKGKSGGGVDVGGSFATTEVNPIVRANIRDGSVIDAVSSVTVEATAKPQEGDVPDYSIESVNVGNDTLQVSDHGLDTGQIVEYATNGNTHIGGLSDPLFEDREKPDGTTESVAVNREYAVINLGNDTLAFGGRFDGDAVDLNADVPVGVDSDTEIIHFQSEHGLKTGDKVVYRAVSGSIGGLTDGTAYWVLVIDATSIKLVDDVDKINNPGDYIDSFLPGDVTGGATDTITITGHGLSQDQAVTYDAPDPLSFTSKQVDVTNATEDGKVKLDSSSGAENIAFIVSEEGSHEGEPKAHTFANGEKVVYSVTSTDGADTPIGGLENGRTYRVVTTGDNWILQLKRSDAVDVNVYYVRTGSADQILRTDSGSWRDDGFAAGDPIDISGSSGNNGSYTIQSISGDGKTITLQGSTPLGNDITRVVQAMTVGTWDDGGTDRVTLTLNSGQTWSSLGITSGTIALLNLPYGGNATINGASGSTLRLNTAYTAGAGSYSAAIVERTSSANDHFDSPVIALTPNKNDADVHSLIRLADLPIGGLVDGKTYYVDLQAGNEANEFGLSETPGGARVSLTPTSLTGVTNHLIDARAEDITAGSGEHDLRIDITGSSISGTQNILGPGGVSLSLIAPQSGDGISSSTVKGSSGAIIGVQKNAANLTAKPTVTADITATLVRAGDNVTVSTYAQTNTTTSATNGSGGFVAVGNTDAIVSSDLTSNASVGDGTTIVAGDNFTLAADSFGQSKSSSTSKTGGFVGSADAESYVDLDYDTTTDIGANAVILVGDLAKLRATSSVKGNASATARGVGFGGNADANAHFITDSATTKTTLGVGALLEAREAILTATVDDVDTEDDNSRGVDISVATDARAGGFYSEGDANNNLTYSADTDVEIGSDAKLTGFEGVDLIVTYDDVKTYSKAYSRSTGLFGHVGSNAGNTTTLRSKVMGGDDALVTAGPRIEVPNDNGESTELAQFMNADFRLALYASTENGAIDYDKNGRVSKRSLAGGSAHEPGSLTETPSIDFDSDVLILSGRSPELITKELTRQPDGPDHQGCGGDGRRQRGRRSAGADEKKTGEILSDTIVVNDITNPGPGDVVFDSKYIDRLAAAPGRSVSRLKG